MAPRSADEDPAARNPGGAIQQPQGSVWGSRHARTSQTVNHPCQGQAFARIVAVGSREAFHHVGFAADVPSTCDDLNAV